MKLRASRLNVGYHVILALVWGYLAAVCALAGEGPFQPFIIPFACACAVEALQAIEGARDIRGAIRIRNQLNADALLENAIPFKPRPRPPMRFIDVHEARE